MQRRRELREKQARLNCAFSSLGVDPTKWSLPTPGQATKIKGALKPLWKVAEPVQVYRQLELRKRDPNSSEFAMYGLHGDLMLVPFYDGSGEVYLAHVRDENEVERQARIGRSGDELKRAAEFVQRTGKAPPGWRMKRSESPILMSVPGRDPVPVPTIDIMPEGEPVGRTISIGESTIKGGYKP
jgi:hypothetical protein